MSKRPIPDLDEEWRYGEWEGVRYPAILRKHISRLEHGFYLEPCEKQWEEWYVIFANRVNDLGVVLLCGERDSYDSLVKVGRAELRYLRPGAGSSKGKPRDLIATLRIELLSPIRSFP